MGWGVGQIDRVEWMGRLKGPERYDPCPQVAPVLEMIGKGMLDIILSLHSDTWTHHCFPAYVDKQSDDSTSASRLVIQDCRIQDEIGMRRIPKIPSHNPQVIANVLGERVLLAGSGLSWDWWMQEPVVWLAIGFSCCSLHVGGHTFRSFEACRDQMWFNL